MSGLEYNLIHRFNLGDVLRRSAARRPAQRAFECLNRNLTYADLDALANRVARVLLDSGIRRGDAVAILAPNSPEYVAAFFGCARIGAPLVPINLMLTAEDIDYVLESVRVRALLYDPILAGKLNRDGRVVPAIAHQLALDRLPALDGSAVEQYVENEDAATIIFTSGTTARPKGVVGTHLNWYASLISAFADGEIDRRHRPLLVLPMFHIAGLSVMFSSIAVGADCVILPTLRPEAILSAIAEQQVNYIALPATVWVNLLQAPDIEKYDFSSLEKAAVFQFLPTPAFQRWRELVPHAKWLNYWGQTETTPLGSSTPSADLERKLVAPDPIGFPHLPLELRVVDDDMQQLAAGQVGEFVVRGPSVTPGYFEDPEANRTLFRGGWHHTGDMGYCDQEAFFYFVDRKKDMIKSGGENVSSQEVEEVLAQYPGVTEVAVVGVSDPYWIEKVVAAIQPAPGAQLREDDIIAFARSRLAAFKAPKHIFIMSELPKNSTGKVLKRVLRQDLEARLPQPAGGGV